jgi:glyoxylase-like metal-dependent hydrolase (beta-lactamase superfamily II)
MTAVPTIAAFFDPATHTVSYVVSDSASRRAAIIDPVLDYTAHSARTAVHSADLLLAHLASHDLTPDWILETHAHADHLSAAHYLREKTGAAVVIGAQITKVQDVFAKLFGLADVMPDGSQFDRLVGEGDRLTLGDLDIAVLHTPGHTPACVSYQIGDAVFVGDTMFMPDYGTARCDFPGGSAATLYASIRKLLALPGETRLFIGHDYLPSGRGDFAWETTVAEQRRANVHVHDGIDQGTFVAMREARDATLEAPQLILPSLQVNIRAGQLPLPEANGRRYLKLPLDAI